MECGICFNIIKKSCVGPCNHHYCFLCMIRWCYYKNFCPKCKTEITEIKLDPEYDYLIQEMMKMIGGSEDDICNHCVENVKIDNNKFDNKFDNNKSGLSVSNLDRIPPQLLRKTDETLCVEKSEKIEGIGGGNIREVVITFNGINAIKNLVGLTLCNNEKGPGVIITKIDNEGRAYLCGIKKNDILLFINNVPCIHHKQSTRILKECLAANKNAVCMLF